jgi:hypothetical protein
LLDNNKRLQLLFNNCNRLLFMGKNKPGAGRPATGRTTKVVRIDDRVDEKKAQQMYLDWLPILEAYKEKAGDSPRYYYLNRLLEELGV